MDAADWENFARCAQFPYQWGWIGRITVASWEEETDQSHNLVMYRRKQPTKDGRVSHVFFFFLATFQFNVKILTLMSSTRTLVNFHNTGELTPLESNAKTNTSCNT